LRRILVASIPAAATKCVANAMENHTSDAKCTAADDYFDSVLSLNLKTGKINWGRKVEGYDAWTLACLYQPSGVGWCPSPEGKDYDFGAAPSLFTTRSSAGKPETLIGDGRRSGVTGRSTRPPAASSGTPSSAPAQPTAARCGAPPPTAAKAVPPANAEVELRRSVARAAQLDATGDGVVLPGALGVLLNLERHAPLLVRHHGGPGDQGVGLLVHPIQGRAEVRAGGVSADSQPSP
jgi:hypothetical protein